MLNILCSLKAVVMLIALIQPSAAPVTACSLTHSAPTPHRAGLELPATAQVLQGSLEDAPAEPETKQGDFCKVTYT